MTKSDRTHCYLASCDKVVPTLSDVCYPGDELMSRDPEVMDQLPLLQIPDQDRSGSGHLISTYTLHSIPTHKQAVQEPVFSCLQNKTKQPKWSLFSVCVCLKHRPQSKTEQPQESEL